MDNRTEHCMCIFQHVELASEVSQGCRENLGAGIEEAAPRGSQRSPGRNPVAKKKLCERPGSAPTTAGAAGPAASLRVQVGSPRPNSIPPRHGRSQQLPGFHPPRRSHPLTVSLAPPGRCSPRSIPPRHGAPSKRCDLAPLRSSLPRTLPLPPPVALRASLKPPTRVLQPTREAPAPATRPHLQGPRPAVAVPPHLRPPPPLARPPHMTTPT
ncbi:classical arabinogalactan protein 9-like isoform X1 [Trachypithecus francoisi]|uniref:classical arabinogalactan protein 9-like isoform X1 n=1 Tax=Trachypithecus francoisi TaxID=54180 RepID=UPI00141B3026|nr:classical arabinogalactan protein 9-like isoform X1 [Trachypithecus francoisi]XP_033087948.1 classical arabinogalactan protein 9-like isoform X1 [Trachypithecus francoisi]XP_033087949.1 classical arabinogalactan protein 9-like isoform X1 [Trachypithecus francoisi]XP_033087950.1 classical arabinogalactan protein 9-like isoform X1 [Trachypithecus francoisi]XP_033087951.1 classical arabinogalactan protein 9-like isoform X1 [Trachypithecus francoisi]XP_033087952.1 classical arabinogalactan prot